MINYNLSKFDHFASRPMPAAVNSGIIDSGMALVLVNEGGQGKVKAATGVANEQFFGISQIDGGAMPGSLIGGMTIVGTGAEFTNQIANFKEGTAIIRDETGAVYSGADVAIATDGKVTVAATATAGKTYSITYSYAPTVAQVRGLVGDFNTSQVVNELGAEPGVIRHAVVFVSNFTNDAWVVGDVPKLGAGGNFTRAGAGANAVGCVVTSVPTASSPFLGIEIAF